jgi:hypothetical protein
VEPVEALHTAVRRYCDERAERIERDYAALLEAEARAREQAGHTPAVSPGYSPEGLATFPRYNVLYAIQAAVEAFVPGDLGSLEQARELLAAAIMTAESGSTRPPNGETQQRVMDEERELLDRYTQKITTNDLLGVEPLPFRRTLSRAESNQLRSELERRWGIEPGYWYPLDRGRGKTAPEHTLAFNAAPFEHPELQELVRSRLAGLGITRLFELHEYDRDTEDKEIELALLDPSYYGNGGEGIWTDDSFTCVIYASHEESTTIAGRDLLPALQHAWPDWQHHLYD